MPRIPNEIFKAYDIRGIVGKTLTRSGVHDIGLALGAEAQRRQITDMAIGYDGRLSSPDLAAALATGLQDAGINVIDLGQVATPMAYFAAHQLGCHAVAMVTGSHNPPDYNGIKMVLAGVTMHGVAIQNLHKQLDTDDLAPLYAPQRGHYQQQAIADAYRQRICGDVKLARPMKIIVDAGNGVAGAFAPALYRALGCSVEELHCEVDGRFPHHHPDPSIPANLADLIARLQTSDAEIGLAFDGDGDRLGVVTKAGNIIFPDRQLMLFAADVLSRNPAATIIFDVKSSRNLFAWITQHGGVPLMWKSGHSLIKAKMQETGALLAGEMSGHIFFKERWYGFDDGLYAGARLLEILAQQTDSEALLNDLPNSLCTPELQIALPEGEAQALVATIVATSEFVGAREINTIDGLRIEYADGFALIRASNTTPALVLRFEADNACALARIKQQIAAVIQKAAALPIASGAKHPFPPLPFPPLPF